MDLWDVLGKFQLETLDKIWVDKICQEDFSNEKELPSEYELQFDEESICDLMVYLRDSVKEWLTESVDTHPGTSRDSLSERKSWQTLINSSFDYKGLLAVLSTYVKLDVKELNNEESRKSALAATRLYFILLSIHGAQIFNIYNSILFAQAIETLKIVNVIDNNIVKPQTKKKSKKKNDQIESFQEDEESEVISISQNEKRELFKTLSETLKDLHFCLKNLHLRNYSEMLVQTIQVMVSIIKLEKSSTSFLESKPKSTQNTFLAYKAYEILLSFCSTSHGEPEDVVRFIMKSFLPELTLSEQDLHVSAKPKALVREHILIFISKIIETVNEHSHQGIMALIQQLCIRTPDKADVRAKCVHQIIEILNRLPCDLFMTCVMWILSLSHAESTRNRTVAIELISKLLSLQERDKEITDRCTPTELRACTLTEGQSPTEINQNLEEEENPISSNSDQEEQCANKSVWVNHNMLLAAVLSRCLDISPTVRAKSLSIFTPLILSHNSVIKNIMAEMFVNPYKTINVIECVIPSEPKMFNFNNFFSKRNTQTLPTNVLPGGTVVMDLIEKLTLDTKVFVRKSSLQVLINICKLNPKWITPQRINNLEKACKDVSVMIRKLMSQGLTELLLLQVENEELQKAWVNGVIPLIADNEPKSQEKVVEIVGNIILDYMVPYNKTSSAEHLLPWKMLKMISSLGMRRLFRFVCRQWETLKRVSSKEIDILRTHIGTENNLPAWFLLVCISEFQTLNKPDFILEYYFENIYGVVSVNEYCSQLVLECVHLNWRECKIDLVDKLCDKLKVSLESFSIPFTMIARCVDICTMRDKDGAKEWSSKLVQLSESFIQKVLPSNFSRSLKMDLSLTQHIFTLGEAIQQCPGVLQKDTIKLLINLIDPEKNVDDDISEQDQKIGGMVKAVTVITLGKLCLQNQFISKSVVPIFGTLLEKSSTPVKINTLISLTDLCIRFTSLIEPYLGDMCVCLKDSDPRVRRITLTLITQLVQEDYIKLKCPIFFYLLCMIIDPDNIIRENTIAFLVNTVLAKTPKIMVQQFVQGIYFYNDFNEIVVSQIEISPQERRAFCLSGKTNKDQRRNIFKFMLDHMEDDHKFKLTTQICTEILGNLKGDKVCEGSINLDNKGETLLQDALFSLACEELRLGHTKSGKEDEEDAIEDVGNILRSNILTQLLKRSYIEVAVPIILKLKHKLTQLKSPLLRELMIALRELMKDYKEEIDEIIGTDCELAAEVALDLRNLQNEQSEEEQEEEIIENTQTLVMKELRITCERLTEDIIRNGGMVFNSEDDILGLPGAISRPSGQPGEPSKIEISTANDSLTPTNATTRNQKSNTLSPSFNTTSPVRKRSSGSPSFAGHVNSTKSEDMSPSVNSLPSHSRKSNTSSKSNTPLNKQTSRTTPSPASARSQASKTSKKNAKKRRKK